MKELAISLGLFFLFVIVMLMPDGRVSRAEKSAEKVVCKKMADDVLAGKESRFDYMTTRCPAKFLVKVEKE